MKKITVCMTRLLEKHRLQITAAAEAAERTIRANFGNPSSLYRLGLDAEKEVKAARRYLIL